MNIRRLMTGILIVVTLLPAAGCGSGVDYEPLELVPEKAGLIAGIRVSDAVRDWQIYCELKGNEIQEEQFDDMKAEFLENTGLDMNSISEAVLFTDVSEEQSGEGMGGYSGAVLTGNFADRELIERIAENTETTFTEKVYGDYTIHLGGKEKGGIVKLNNTMIIMGTEDALRDCIDVAEGKQNAVSGVIMDTYESLGESMLRLAMTVPEGERHSLPEQSEQAIMGPVGLEPFEKMETIGLAADLGTQALTMKMHADFTDTESAAGAAGSLETMLNFFALMSQEEEMTEMLDRIKITVSASRMHLSYDIPLAELAEMLESVGDADNFSDFPSMLPGGGISGEFEFPGMPENPWDDETE